SGRPARTDRGAVARRAQATKRPDPARAGRRRHRRSRDHHSRRQDRAVPAAEESHGHLHRRRLREALAGGHSERRSVEPGGGELMHPRYHPYFRSYELPWSLEEDQEQRFRRLWLILLVAALVLGAILWFVKVPEPVTQAETAVPPRLAKLLIEREPPPPP